MTKSETSEHNGELIQPESECLLTPAAEKQAALMFFFLGCSSLSIFNIVTVIPELWQYLMGSSRVVDNFPLFYNTPCLPMQVVYLLYMFHIPSKAQIIPSTIMNIVFIVYCLIFAGLSPDARTGAASELVFGMGTIAGAFNALLNASLFAIGGAFNSGRVLGAIMAGQGLVGLAPSVIALVINVVRHFSKNALDFGGVCFIYFGLCMLLVLPTPFAVFALYRSKSTSAVMRTLDDKAYWGLARPVEMRPISQCSGSDLGDGEDTDATSTSLPGTQAQRTRGRALAGITDILVNLGRALRFCWVDGLGVLSVFAFTLAVYPSVIVSYSPSDDVRPPYVRLMWQSLHALCFVLSDFHGRSIKWRPRTRGGKIAIHVTAYARAAVICTLLYAYYNLFPRNMAADVTYFFLIYCFGISNGMSSTALMGWGPTHAPDEATRALSGAWMSLALNGGLSIGVLFSKFAQKMIK